MKKREFIRFLNNFNMDDASWEFFCNNSPKLIEKTRPRTPFIAEKTIDLSIPKLLPSSSTKQRLFKRPSNLIKSAFRAVYRDVTPRPIIINKNLAKKTVCASKSPLNPQIKTMIPKDRSPSKHLKNSLAPLKKLSIKNLKLN